MRGAPTYAVPAAATVERSATAASLREDPPFCRMEVIGEGSLASRFVVVDRLSSSQDAVSPIHIAETRGEKIATGLILELWTPLNPFPMKLTLFTMSFALSTRWKGLETPNLTFQNHTSPQTKLLFTNKIMKHFNT